MGGEDGGKGGGVQRAGLVGDQMSSQWGRNDEVRMEGRRDVRKGGFLSSCHAMPVVYTMSILLNMLINHCKKYRRCKPCCLFHVPFPLRLSQCKAHCAG